MAHKLGLPMPEIVLMERDPALADTEPDPEIQDLIRASAGTNPALDYLPGSFAYDLAAFSVDSAGRPTFSQEPLSATMIG